jgi:hypothetical protein
MLREWGTSRDASLCESLVHYRKRLSPARSLIRFRANSTAPPAQAYAEHVITECVSKNASKSALL